MRNPKAKCSNCPWYSTQSGESQCRKGPPVVVTVDVDDEGAIYRAPASVYPAVQPDNWCGVHPDLFVQGEEQFMGSDVEDQSFSGEGA